MKTDSFKILSADVEAKTATLVNKDNQIMKFTTNSTLEINELKLLKNNVKEVNISYEDNIIYFVVPKITFKQNSYIRNFINTIENEYRKITNNDYLSKANFRLLKHEQNNLKIPGHSIVNIYPMELSELESKITYNEDFTQISLLGLTINDFDILEKIALCCCYFDGAELLVDNNNTVINMKDLKSISEKYSDFEFIKNNRDMYNIYSNNCEIYSKLEECNFSLDRYDLKIDLYDCMHLYPSKESNVFLKMLLDESSKQGTYEKSTLSLAYSDYKNSIPISICKDQKTKVILDHIKNMITEDNINKLYELVQNNDLDITDIILDVDSTNKKLPLGSFSNNDKNNKKLPPGSLEGIENVL